MITTGLIIAGLFVITFWMGAQYATNRIMNNMMKDLVEIKDLTRWLRVWT
jgi:Na+/H+ antiporter NhaC